MWKRTVVDDEWDGGRVKRDKQENYWLVSSVV